MDSVKVTLTDKLKTLFEQGQSLGTVLFSYDPQGHKYVGQIKVPPQQALLWQIPDFLANVPPENIEICLVPHDIESESDATFFIHIGYLKHSQDPQQFDMEIKSCAESLFNEGDMLPETDRENQ